MKRWVWAFVAAAVFIAGCGGSPKVGDPCTDSVRVCGDNGVGLGCQDRFFVQICATGCKPNGDNITCSGRTP